MKTYYLILPFCAIPGHAFPKPLPSKSFDDIFSTHANKTGGSFALAVVAAILTDIQATLTMAGNITTTQNGLAGSLTMNGTMNCTAMTVLFARGTLEPGNVGLLAGPPFFDALTTMMPPGTVTIQGINYVADTRGFLAGGDPAGSQLMATTVQQVLNRCPQTKLVMSGYSQGGQLVHNAASMLPAAAMLMVSSVVIFGDPDNGKPVAGTTKSTVKVICHTGDNICAGGDEVLVPHLTYADDAGAAAMFVAAQSALGIDSAIGLNGTMAAMAAMIAEKAKIMGIGG